MSIEVHKQSQFTCQANTVTSSSLTPIVALLVHPSGTAHSIVDYHEFTGSQNDANESRPVVLSLVYVDSAKVWLSCQAIIGISVLVELFWVFANPVTYVNKVDP